MTDGDRFNVVAHGLLGLVTRMEGSPTNASSSPDRDDSTHRHAVGDPLAPGWIGARALSVSAQVLAACAAVAMLRYAAPVLLPIVLALLLFYALDPIVDRIERWGSPRVLASVLVVLLLVGGISVGAYALWPQVTAVVEQVPDGAAKLRRTLRDQKRQPGDSVLQRIQQAAKAIDSAAAEVSEPPAGTPGVVRVEVQQPVRVSDWLWTGGMSAVSLAGQALMILFLTIFLLNENDSFKRRLVHRMDSLGSKRITVEILNQIASQIEGFIWVQALTSAFVALVTGLALWWLDVDQPAVWGVFAGVMNVVPYFGPLIVSATLAVVAFLQFGTVLQAFAIAGAALAITTLEGMVLTPHLLSRAASLNHVAIFLAIAFWSWAWGVPGMLLAVPMLMAFKAVCDHVEGLQTIAEFLRE
jgi:predicted PurR-regulated permease PerM